MRSAIAPHTKLITIATRVRSSRITLAVASETPRAFVVTTLITTITVFTASE